MNRDAARKLSPLALVALVAAAALDVTGRIGQVGPARFTAYQMLAASAAIFAGWLLLTRRERLSRTPLNIPVLAFLGTAALSVAFATERLPALVQLVSLTSSVVLAAIVVIFVRQPRQGVATVLGVLAVSSAASVLAVLEWAGVFALQHPVFFTPGYGIRARVTFLDPNILASFLMFAVLLAVPVLLTKTVSRGGRAAGWIGVALTLFGLFTTFSRGGLGGLLVGAVCIVALLPGSWRAKLGFVVASALVVVIVGSLVFNAGWVATNVFDLGSNGSTMNRIYMAEGALHMWVDHPFGVGLDNYQVVYPKYRDPRAEPGIVESHTAYITVLVEMGFLGLAAFLWLLWRFFARSALPVAHRARDPRLRALATGALAAGAGLCAQAFTYSLEGSKFLWFSIGLGAAAWAMYESENRSLAEGVDDAVHA